MCLVAQSCLTLCDPMDYSLPGSSVHGDFPGKNTGVDCHAFLQGIFPTQGSNPGLVHYRQINKDLLYSTGNSAQYSVMAYMGKELEILIISNWFIMLFRSTVFVYFSVHLFY